MVEIDEATKELLQKLGFTEGKNEGDYQTEIEGGYAHVDFRKENGRRWAIVNRNFVKDPDSIEILKQFKEERDKLLQSSNNDKEKEARHDTKNANVQTDIPIQNDLSMRPGSKKSSELDEVGRNPPLKSSGDVVERQNNTIAGDVGQETILNPLVPSIHTPPDVKCVPAPNSPNLYEFFYELVGAGGIIEIFGDTGSLKSQLCTETCKDATKLGKKYYYLDTEGKVGLFNKKVLGGSYQYLPVWDEILKKLKSDLPKGDLLIVDSIGFPISTEYADMKANQQGDTLQDMMAAVGKHLKVWAYKNNAIVIFTNQPKSTFMKSDEELDRLSAFGDKVHFAPNIILKTTKSIIPGHYDQVAKKVIPPKSIGTFTSFRSTDFMDDVEILSITKNDNEVIIVIPAHVTKRLQDLRG